MDEYKKVLKYRIGSCGTIIALSYIDIKLSNMFNYKIVIGNEL
jgi:hypothetical protein